MYAQFVCRAQARKQAAGDNTVPAVDIRNNVADQTPIINAIKNTGDESGQFVFRRK